MSQIFKDTFERYQRRILKTGAKSLAEADPEVVRQMIAEIIAAKGGTTEQYARFVEMTVHVFLNNDMNTATRFLMQHSQGSFGFSAASTLYPERVVLAVKEQPLSLAFHPEEKRRLLGVGGGRVQGQTAPGQRPHTLPPGPGGVGRRGRRTNRRQLQYFFSPGESCYPRS